MSTMRVLPFLLTVTGCASTQKAPPPKQEYPAVRVAIHQPAADTRPRFTHEEFSVPIPDGTTLVAVPGSNIEWTRDGKKLGFIEVYRNKVASHAQALAVRDEMFVAVTKLGSEPQIVRDTKGAIWVRVVDSKGSNGRLRDRAIVGLRNLDDIAAVGVIVIRCFSEASDAECDALGDSVKLASVYDHYAPGNIVAQAAPPPKAAEPPPPTTTAPPKPADPAPSRPAQPSASEAQVRIFAAALAQDYRKEGRQFALSPTCSPTSSGSLRNVFSMRSGKLYTIYAFTEDGAPNVRTKLFRGATIDTFIRAPHTAGSEQGFKLEMTAGSDTPAIVQLEHDPGRPYLVCMFAMVK